MKKFLKVALAAFFSTTVATPLMAQAPFFLNRQGAEAEYALKDAKGEITSYTKSVVTALSSNDPQNFTATYTAEVFDKNHRSLAPATEVSVTVRDGAVDTTPVMEGMEIEGTMPSFPANMSVGQELEFSFAIKVMGMKTTTEGKNTVVAQESVTTPAGTFDCFKVETETTTKAMLARATTVKTITWLAAGIGTVKSEIYDNRDRLQSSQELVSVK